MPSTLTKAHPWPTLAELRGHPTAPLQSFSKMPKDTKIRTMRTVKAISRNQGKRVIIANVESYNAHSGRKSDMFGIFDAVAIECDYDPRLVIDNMEGYLNGFSNQRIRALQACGGDWQSHITKLRENIETCALWLAAQNTTLELWGWRKIKRGSRRVIRPRLQLITLDFLLEKESAIVHEVFLD